jgi:hypothetical protein
VGFVIAFLSTLAILAYIPLAVIFGIAEKYKK